MLWQVSSSSTVGTDTYILTISYTCPWCYAYPSYDSMHPNINGASLPQEEKGPREAYSKSSSEILH